MVERQTPVLIQNVFEERAEEERAKKAAEEEERVLKDKQRTIKDMVIGLMTSSMPNPDKVRIPKVKPMSHKKLMESLSEGFSPRFFDPEGNNRKEREAEEYQFKVNYPLVFQEEQVDITLLSHYFPEGDKAHTLRVDVSILPHTFDIHTEHHADVGVTVVSKKDKFYASHPGYLGSPGAYGPTDNRWATTADVDGLIDSLQHIKDGIKDKSIKPQNLTDQSAIVGEARMRQSTTEKII